MNETLINEKVHKIYHFETSFGANLNVVKMEGRKLKSAFITFRFGSINSKFELNNCLYNIPDGTAHYMEHLLFNEEHGADYTVLFEQLGADSNAGTGKEATTFFFNTVLNFDECFKLLIKMVYKNNFSNKIIKKEFPIISQEISMINDMVENQLSSDLLSMMYHNNPVKKEIGGTKEEISKIDLDIIKTIHKCFYSPKNSNITIIGDFEEDEILEFVEHSYKDLNIVDYFESNYKIVPFEEPDWVVSSYSILEKPVLQPVVSIGIKLDLPNIDDVEQLKKQISIMLLNIYLFSKSGVIRDILEKRKAINNSFDWNFYLMNTYQFLSFTCEIDDYEHFIKEFKKVLGLIPSIKLDKEKFESLKRSELGRKIRLMDDYDNLVDISDYYTFHRYSNDENINTLLNLDVLDLVECLPLYEIRDNLSILVYTPEFHKK